MWASLGSKGEGQLMVRVQLSTSDVSHCLPHSFLADLVSELMPQPPEVIETYATLK